MTVRIFEIVEPGFRLTVDMDDGYVMPFERGQDVRKALTKLVDELRHDIFTYTDHPFVRATHKADGTPFDPIPAGVSWVPSCARCSSPSWRHPPAPHQRPEEDGDER